MWKKTALAFYLATYLDSARAEDDESEDEPEKTSVDVVNSGGYTMTLDWWVAKVPEIEFSPLFLYFETTLSGFTVFTEDILVGQWYAFY